MWTTLLHAEAGAVKIASSWTFFAVANQDDGWPHPGRRSCRAPESARPDAVDVRASASVKRAAQVAQDAQAGSALRVGVIDLQHSAP
jgi:hypothetical protein